MEGWIGVDLDGTLAGWGEGENSDLSCIGRPIMPMVERVKRWLAMGIEVRIFTARVGATGLQSRVCLDDASFAASQRKLVEDWCEEHFGVRLPVTATKDFAMTMLWDDRAVRVARNSGAVSNQLEDEVIVFAGGVSL